MRLVGAVLLSGCMLAQPVRQAGGPITFKAGCTLEMANTLSLPCSEAEPCPLFLELADIAAVGNRLVLTGNVHTQATTIESVLLVSEDGGATWAEGHARIPSAVLDQIQFLDYETGWISGHLMQSLPRDAFLLLTSDGGKTWRRHAVSSESRVGVIEQFWFDSRSHGMLAIDRVRAVEGGLRYEIWESMTGGSSWSVRQVHQEPLVLKKPERERLWRIRSDAPAKSNRIERHENNRWVSVATFGVGAGQCRPEEAAAVDEPPAPQSPESAPPSPAKRDPKAPALRKPRPE